MFFTQSEQYDSLVFGHEGRPDSYPEINGLPDLLFYIQRNQNINTVIYEANFLSGNVLNLSNPIKISWINFTNNGDYDIQDLNYIQKKLAYGYEFDVISNDLIEFRFVSYPQLSFYLAKNAQGRFSVFTTFMDVRIELKMIYIYAEDMGVFPQVKFAEFYGKEVISQNTFYKKLLLQ